MKFNYSKLLGKIKECGLTQEKLAKIVGINKGTLNAKLKNKNSFTAAEMENIRSTLNISKDEIGDYFFAEKVQKN
jgi:transcriptional regulator with XRE-family HTH domain